MQKQEGQGVKVRQVSKSRRNKMKLILTGVSQ